MSDGGKGDKRIPAQVPDEQVKKNWDAIDWSAHTKDKEDESDEQD